MRKIKIFSTKSNSLKDFISGATTWSQLKSELNNKGIEHDGMKATIKETRNVLEDDGAILPDGEFTVFLTPSKVKSGAAWEGMDYNAVRKYAVSKGIAATGSGDDIKKRLDKAFNTSKQEVVSTQKASIAKKVADESVSLHDKLDTILSNQETILANQVVILEAVEDVEDKVDAISAEGISSSESEEEKLRREASFLS